MRTMSLMKALKRRRASAGFTIGETLVAVMILLLMSGAMVVGVNFATREYKNAVQLSDARVLSNSVSDIIRNELYTNPCVMSAEDGSVSFYNSERTNSQEFELNEEGRLCMKITEADSSLHVPILSSRAYSARGLKLNNLVICFVESNGKDFGYGSYHVAFDVIDETTEDVLISNDFDVMALNKQ